MFSHLDFFKPTNRVKLCTKKQTYAFNKHKDSEILEKM